MEILNNIWNILTTEQEVIVDLFSIPCTFIESYIFMCLFTSILRIPCTKEQKLKFTCIFAIICTLAYYFIPAPFYSILDYIIMFILIKKIFKLNTIKSI